jgi:predicted site-specific integrase-resolvase
MIKTYTLQDLEKILGVKERTLFRYLEKGWLKGSKRGKWRFTDSDIQHFLNNGRRRKKQ